MIASCILKHHQEVEMCSLNHCWIGYISRQASVILSVLPTFRHIYAQKTVCVPGSRACEAI